MPLDNESDRELLFEIRATQRRLTELISDLAGQTKKVAEDIEELKDGRLLEHDKDIAVLKADVSGLSKRVYGALGAFMLVLVSFFIWFVQSKR